MKLLIAVLFGLLLTGCAITNEYDQQWLKHSSSMLGKTFWVNNHASLVVCPTKRALLEYDYYRNNKECAFVTKGKFTITDSAAGGSLHLRWYAIAMESGLRGWVYAGSIEDDLGQCWANVALKEPDPNATCPRHGIPKVGMSKDEIVIRGWSNPDKVQSDISSKGHAEIWKFGKVWIYLRDNVVYMTNVNS